MPDVTEGDEKEEPGKRRRPGPVPGPHRRQYTVQIEPEVGDWGKMQPGGLSGLVRRLLLEEKRRQESGQTGQTGQD